MLVVQQLTKQFGDLTAVNDVSLSLQRGEMYGLLGANGAGKTTTFRQILRILEPTSGTITWDGKPFSYETSDWIGYLPEERGLYPKEKVSDQLVFLAGLKGMKRGDAIQQLKQWLERFQISDYFDKKVEQLSKGNQQKIQVIAALLHRPQLVILDEPFSGLDPINVELLKAAVRELQQNGTAIIFSSHRMEHVEELCEQLSILYRGKQVVAGSLKEIKRSFGKKNIIVHADFAVDDLANVDGVVKFTPTIEGCELQIADESVAQAVFTALHHRGFVRQFRLAEPSLHEIFVEKVGEAYE